jgi:hypothetical protein
LSGFTRTNIARIRCSSRHLGSNSACSVSTKRKIIPQGNLKLCKFWIKLFSKSLRGLGQRPKVCNRAGTLPPAPGEGQAEKSAKSYDKGAKAKRHNE